MQIQLIGMYTSSELCTTKEIAEKIKDILSTKKKGKAVFDKDVAGVLRINATSFASMKKRNKIPNKQISDFCNRCGLDPRDIILKTKSC